MITADSYQLIRATGYIIPSDSCRKTGAAGYNFGMDVIAGDHLNVFLSVGQPYGNLTDEPLYLIQFDAHRLVDAHRAAVGPDLFTDYAQIIHEVIDQTKSLANENDEELLRQMLVFSTRTAPINAKDCPEIAQYFGEEYDPEQPIAHPAIAEAALMFRERATKLQEQKRVTGELAHKRLHERKDSDPPLELLVPHPLPISCAVYRGRLESHR